MQCQSRKRRPRSVPSRVRLFELWFDETGRRHHGANIQMSAGRRSPPGRSIIAGRGISSIATPRRRPVRPRASTCGSDNRLFEHRHHALLFVRLLTRVLWLGNRRLFFLILDRNRGGDRAVPESLFWTGFLSARAMGGDNWTIIEGSHCTQSLLNTQRRRSGFPSEISEIWPPRRLAWVEAIELLPEGGALPTWDVSWFGRKGPFLRPGVTTPRRPRAAAVKDGRRPPRLRGAQRP